jgi:hypothetical protein
VRCFLYNAYYTQSFTDGNGLREMPWDFAAPDALLDETRDAVRRTILDFLNPTYPQLALRSFAPAVRLSASPDVKDQLLHPLIGQRVEAADPAQAISDSVIRKRGRLCQSSLQGQGRSGRLCRPVANRS